MIRLVLALLVAAVLAVSSAGAAPGDPRVRVNSADQALARTLGLQASDLSGTGWRMRTSFPVHLEIPNPPCVLRYLDISAATLTGGRNVAFQRPGTIYESSVEIFARPAQAAAVFKKQTSAGGAACVASVVANAIGNGLGAKATLRRHAHGPLQVRAGVRAAYNSVALSVPLKGRTIVVFFYEFSLWRGRVFTTLDGYSPTSPAVDRTASMLARTLANRLLAHLKVT